MSGCRRQFCKQFDLHTATGPEQTLATLRTEPGFAVVLSDLRMADSADGIELLARVQPEWPDTVRVMMTGHADLSVVLKAVNEGHVFRFLEKPCPPEALAEAFKDGLRQHDLANSRMRDFYDIRALSREFDFDGGVLSTAIQAITGKAGRPTTDLCCMTVHDENVSRIRWEPSL